MVGGLLSGVNELDEIGFGEPAGTQFVPGDCRRITIGEMKSSKSATNSSGVSAQRTVRKAAHTPFPQGPCSRAFASAGVLLRDK